MPAAHGFEHDDWKDEADEPHASSSEADEAAEAKRRDGELHAKVAVMERCELLRGLDRDALRSLAKRAQLKLCHHPHSPRHQRHHPASSAADGGGGGDERGFLWPARGGDGASSSRRYGPRQLLRPG